MTPFIYVRKMGDDYQTTLTVGVQTFAISPPRVTDEEAVWMGDMLTKALESAGLHGIERRNPYPEDGDGVKGDSNG